MKIVCPSCDATYEVPERVATSRRKMRCARCAMEWVPADGLAPAADAEPAAPPAAAPVVAPAAVMPAAAAPAQDFHDEAATAAPMPAPIPAPVAIAPEPAPLAQAAADFDGESAMDLPLTALVVVPPRPVTVLPSAEAASRPPGGPATNFTQRGVPPPEEKGAPMLAWGGSVTVLALAIAAALVFKAPLMKIWPPSTRLYAAIGMVQP